MTNIARWMTGARTLLIAGGALALGPTSWAGIAEDLIPRGAEWRFKDDGSDQGAGWREPDFDDASWTRGSAQLGYGDGDEKTVVSYGSDKNKKFVTTYFRHTFTIADPASYQKLESIGVQAMCDDGCAVYLNGKEVARFNLPDGAITHTTLATTAADGERESQYMVGSASSALLRKGKNVVAVEVHQQRPSSSDISFDLQLMSTTGPKPTAPAAALGRLSDSTEVAIRMVQSQRSEVLRAALTAVTNKIVADKARHDTASVRRLVDLEEELAIQVRGAWVPTFFRKPVRFAAAPAGESIRFVAFGDFGYGSPDQKAVADAIQAEHRKASFDFGITLGDNFYGSGLPTVEDERWISRWEDLYTPLGVKFYPSLGNHDWYHPDSPVSEILYSQKSKSWHLPSIYYSYTAGPVEFFALNTEVLTEKQLQWLEEGLENSAATWKVVYGHHPLYSPGSHGDGTAMVTKLMPILKGRADVYIAGHDHILAHVKAQEGVEFFVSGGGGASSYRVDSTYSRTAYAQPIYGFLAVDASRKSLKFTFIGVKGQELYSYSLKK